MTTQISHFRITAVIRNLDLSEPEQEAARLAIAQLLIADRKEMLGRLQLLMGQLKTPQVWRTLADKVLTDYSDLPGQSDEKPLCCRVACLLTDRPSPSPCPQQKTIAITPT